jgi:hypothetical protein
MNTSNLFTPTAFAIKRTDTGDFFTGSGCRARNGERNDMRGFSIAIFWFS